MSQHLEQQPIQPSCAALCAACCSCTIGSIVYNESVRYRHRAIAVFCELEPSFKNVTSFINGVFSTSIYQLIKKESVYTFYCLCWSSIHDNSKFLPINLSSKPVSTNNEKSTHITCDFNESKKEKNKTWLGEGNQFLQAVQIQMLPCRWLAFTNIVENSHGHSRRLFDFLSCTYTG